ncbi:hypothetical protein [Streptomyces sp. H27-H5]|uniref:hypothetical protein n=1 Tax=Streptomyces sp. H27-H5 TaxID=2996460 RepID=UPI002271F083|nr:hypothetical protein [Streptomyces sp. H27-H5]MCY0962737.1 hypothetical protein [Streptomyces sp. H27-H5]
MLVTYLRSLPEMPAGSVRGDMTEHVAGDTTVYLEHSGGYRVVRDAEDRADIEYSVYSLDRKACIDLAMSVREKLLEELPGMAVAGALVLDVEDIAIPSYFPDDSSREHMYGGEIAVFLTAAQ